MPLKADDLMPVEDIKFTEEDLHIGAMKTIMNSDEIVIRPLTEKDEQALERALNSTTMSDSAREHFKRNQEKTKHIKIGNLNKKLDI